MSSREFEELRGISGTAVAARAAILESREMRALVWFLQACSLEPGGLKRLAREILERFSDRIGTPSMHKFGMKPDRVYSADQIKAIREEMPEAVRIDFPLRGEKWCYAAETFAEAANDPYNDCDDLTESKRHPNSYPVSQCLKSCQQGPEELVEFVTDLCVNPRIALHIDGKRADEDKYQEQLRNEFRDDSLQIESAKLWWFQDIVGALIEYKRCREEKAKADFALTAIGKAIWKTLDHALKVRGMVLIDGLEGRGKTEAVRAWCETHLGEARFVSLKGIANKTTTFREIAKALGIAASYTRTAVEMQARIEDVLQRSKLNLVVDEAHFLFNQSHRMYTRPELLDWADTALVNRGVPLSLVTTPQFMICMRRAVNQVGWNYRQFRRRLKRHVKLPLKNEEHDIEAVARKVFPGAGAATIKLILGYAILSKRDLSAIGDVAGEVRAMLDSDDLSKATFDQVKSAIQDNLIPSDQAFAESFAGVGDTGRNKRKSPMVRPDAERDPLSIENDLAGAIAPRRRSGNFEPLDRNRVAVLTPG